MARRNIILLIATCFLVALFSVGTRSQTRVPYGGSAHDSESVRKMAQERGKAPANEREARMRRSRRKARRTENARTSKAELAERRSLSDKIALGVSEEQWKVIKPKIDKVRLLRSRAGVHPRLTGSSSSGSGSDSRATIQWSRDWEDKDPNELTEGQKLVDKILRRLDTPGVRAEEFQKVMDGLRAYRRQYGEQVPQARQELRKGLTVRQEAALVLMGLL